MKATVNLEEGKEVAGSSAQRNRNHIPMSQEKWDHYNNQGWQWERRQKWKPKMRYDRASSPCCSSPGELKL